MRSAADGSLALAAALRGGGGDLAAALRTDPVFPADFDPAAPGPAQVAAAGPRAAGHGADYELLVEMVSEGAALHYGVSRCLAPADPDLALLLGDQLYAIGLARLTELGDLDAVAELADLISLVAAAEAAASPDLAAAVWAAGARAIGWGTSPGHERAKRLAREGSPDAACALRAAAGHPGS
ncbi:MAG: hypothetical protein M3022_16200 [Actinomycetota bacterium]|nr:hypothetical protein [Actinomycetota bacterium]